MGRASLLGCSIKSSSRSTPVPAQRVPVRWWDRRKHATCPGCASRVAVRLQGANRWRPVSEPAQSEIPDGSSYVDHVNTGNPALFLHSAPEAQRNGDNSILLSVSGIPSLPVKNTRAGRLSPALNIENCRHPILFPASHQSPELVRARTGLSSGTPDSVPAVFVRPSP